MADLYFDKSIGEVPWHESSLAWLRDTLQQEIGASPQLGRIFCGRVEIEELLVPELHSEGKPTGEYRLLCEDPNPSRQSMVRSYPEKKYKKGLSGRHIALWQSHGRYYNENKDCWDWQRPALFRTLEDLYTQTYVVPFLIPMLENAGAYVMTPRERDTQTHEIICDNDKQFGECTDPAGRTHGLYSEEGRWSDAGQGFADAQEFYLFGDNPFRMGSARMAVVNAAGVTAKAVWTPVIKERGNYAVYVSYKTRADSSPAARYTVRHLGGESVFLVNQQMGGGTWIYLGSFEFGEGEGGSVTLDNGVPAGRRIPAGSSVSADAVRFGGGMGKTLRGPKDAPLSEWSTSGLPSFAEGASYWLNWAGIDTSAVRKWSNDYVNDYASRGAWVEHMKDSRNVPFDLSLAFHSDAGSTGDSTTVGTLAIYTLTNEGDRLFKDGSDRMKSRLLASFVQDQVIADIRESFEPEWSRRAIRDKNYSETRTPDVPAMILELLSHQNFADMKYGMDPEFRFTVSRAVYKGILKYLSELYGCPYAVQPLPVHNFSAMLTADGKASLSWSPTPDALEPTAKASGYILYTRRDDGAFDCGFALKDSCIVLPVEEGHIYSYKVEAVGEGGRSFPSEILAVGRAASGDKAPVLIVNNFTRVSGPAIIEKEGYAGFDDRTDSGVPWGKESGFAGEIWCNDPSAEYESNDSPGFGASYLDRAGSVVAGNDFDNCFRHGKAIFACGRSFCSQSVEAFISGRDTTIRTADLICGKQRSTLTGRGTRGVRFELFPAPLRKRLEAFCTRGGRLFISGANIASDVWKPDSAIMRDPDEAEDARRFVTGILGYRLASPDACRSGKLGGMEFYDRVNPVSYCVETADGLRPASKAGVTVLRYGDSSTGAAVRFAGDGWKVFSMGIPLEVLKKEEDRVSVMKKALDWF